MIRVPERGQLAMWWQVDYKGPLLKQKRQHVALIEMDIYSEHRLALTAYDISVKINIYFT